MPTYECPTCHKLTRVQSREDAPHRPFCSHRCKLIDLGAWLDGTYRLEEPLGAEGEEEFPDAFPDRDRM